jgi:fumarate reductase subunit C
MSRIGQVNMSKAGPDKEITHHEGELVTSVEQAKRQWKLDAISTGTGVFLALFMWGHMFFVSSILTGERGFNWISDLFEHYWLAQPTLVVVTIVFFVHFVTASRKIPAKLAERKRVKKLGDDISSSEWNISKGDRKELEKVRPHKETSLWIWQVRSGMIILALGSVHLFVVIADVVQRTFNIGGGLGINAAETMERVQGGMWILYAILLYAVEVHAGIGLYRVTVKWGLGAKIPVIGTRITRRMAQKMERIVLWFFLIIGFLTLLVMAGVIDPPLEFLLPPESGQK